MLTTVGSPVNNTSHMNSTVSSNFSGFSNLDFCNVPSHIWEIIPKKQSLSIQVHDQSAFDIFEAEVRALYGQPDE